MVRITHDISIGNARLRTFSSCEINSAAEVLSDTAVIELPSYNHNVPFDAEATFKRGEKVKILLGYNNKNRVEFEGYLKAISSNNPVRLECEDGMFLFRKKITNKTFKNVDINTLLNYVVEQIGGFTVQSTVSGIRFGRFNIINATAFEVLTKIKQEATVAIFLTGSTLHCHLLYTGENSRIRGRAKYTMQLDIQEGSSFVFLNGKDRKFQVKVEGLTEKNTKVEAQVGDEGGETLLLKRPNISDKTALEKIAKEVWTQRNLDGYQESTLRAWGNQDCEVGFAVTVEDLDLPSRTSSYYATQVRTIVSPETGYQKDIKLGIRLS
jgi:hypothetical protein